LLPEVQLAHLVPRPEPLAERVTVAPGITVHHVPIVSDGFGYQWTGGSHYLALHHLHLTDGETFCDGIPATQERNLRGLMTFVPAGCRIWGWSVPRSTLQSFTALYFDPQHLAPEFGSRLELAAAAPSLYFSDPALRATLEKIRRSLKARIPPDALYLESLSLLAVLEWCRSRQEQPAPVEAFGRLNQSQEHMIRDFVEANLDKDIGLHDLATTVNLSRFHFVRAFKNATQQTPYQFLLSRRIERAKTLLVSSDLPVALLAEKVGFNHATPFIRAFRRMVGVTPGAFRKRHPAKT
jgi:AraC family transcriptional regulator